MVKNAASVYGCLFKTKKARLERAIDKQVISKYTMSSKNEKIKGYKVTDPNGKCRGFQYEVGKTYEHRGPLEMCGSGFHFCADVANCFNYYSFDSTNRVFEVEASGKTIVGDDKNVTDTLTIVRELTWQEVLALANQGKGNTGLKNTGDSNTGDSNTGDWNTGNWNTGYSNTGDRNTGAFCTLDAPFPMFNKKSPWTEQDFKNSRAYSLLCGVDTKIWVPTYAMSEEEKAAHPSHKTADGYLKDIPFKEAFQNRWHNWSAENREAFTSLPNFNWKIFTEITGVEKS